MQDLPKRTKRCLNLINATYYVPGDIVELGVAEGRTSLALGLWLKENGLNKKVYSFDTFSGLPYAGGKLDGDLKKGECNYPLDLFLSKRQELELEDIVIPIVGLVEATLPNFLLDHLVSFAWLDMDLYAPTSLATKLLDPNLCLGAIIGYHDYGFHRTPGIKVVADQELPKRSYCQIADSSYDSIFFTKIKL